MKCVVTNKEIFRKVNQLATEFKKLEFCAIYYADQKEMLTFLKQYRKHAFVYMLVNIYENKKCVIYIGKSSSAYERMLLHKASYEYDEIFLFSVSAEEQTNIEQKMIDIFSPLYNKVGNFEMQKDFQKLGICYGEYKSRTAIREDIRKMMNSNAMGVVSFFLPQKYIYALQKEAEKKKMDINCYIEEILKNILPSSSIMDVVENFDKMRMQENSPDLVTTKEYAAIWGKSVEQIKVYCRNGRIPAIKNKRDWMIPRTAPYPEDRRRK